MFYKVFSGDWQRDTEKTYNDIKVKKYSVYQTVDGFMQRGAQLPNKQTSGSVWDAKACHYG